MAIKWLKNNFGGQYDGYVNGKRIFIAQQNSYGRKLWQFEKYNGGRVFDNSGYDCFTLAIGKKLCEEKLTNEEKGE